MELRSTARMASIQGVKVISRAVDVVRTPPGGIVVLIYHRVGGGTCDVDLPVPVFEEQIRFLAEHIGVVTLEAALDLLARPEPPPRDPVVVTFDDGTADFADTAVPVLERYSVPATIYVATAFLESGQKFPDDGVPLSWQGLRDVLSTGLVTVGSHTHSHALLDRLDLAEAERELDTSIDLIGERLGVGARHFAYPKAICGPPAVEAEIRRRFASAAVAGGTTNPYGDTDPHRLARSPIHISDGVRWFRCKARGGLRLEGALRNALNRHRYVHNSM